MNRKRFNHIVERGVDRSKDILIKKNNEYANETEVFNNFKEAAGISFHTMPEKVAWEFMTKHFQSIKDIIVSVENGGLASQALLDEKFADAHNYLFLIEGMLIERREDNEK